MWIKFSETTQPPKHGVYWVSMEAGCFSYDGSTKQYVTAAFWEFGRWLFFGQNEESYDCTDLWYWNEPLVEPKPPLICFGCDKRLQKYIDGTCQLCHDAWGDD